jgi:DNA-binding MarR family transcriptional regulator
MAEIDRIIHAPARLRIMSALMALQPGTQLDFRTLGRTLGLTDGNLGAHLQTLEEARYIKVEKSFVERKPRTDVAITSRGRTRFEEHVEALREICRVPNSPNL